MNPTPDRPKGPKTPLVSTSAGLHYCFPKITDSFLPLKYPLIAYNFLEGQVKQRSRTPGFKGCVWMLIHFVNPKIVPLVLTFLCFSNFYDRIQAWFLPSWPQRTILCLWKNTQFQLTDLGNCIGKLIGRKSRRPLLSLNILYWKRKYFVILWCHFLNRFLNLAVAPFVDSLKPWFRP